LLKLILSPEDLQGDPARVRDVMEIFTKTLKEKTTSWVRIVVLVDGGMGTQIAHAVDPEALLRRGSHDKTWWYGIENLPGGLSGHPKAFSEAGT
jgi:hypothetical protein